MTYLRVKRISDRDYLYLCKSERAGGRIRQRAIACLGPMMGQGKKLAGPLELGTVPLLKMSAVRFALLIGGEWREFKGAIVQILPLYPELPGTYPLIHYPFNGALCEVQIPWARVAPLLVTLPLAGHGCDDSRRQGVLL